MNRIYVVDDEPDMVELLATVLKGEGHEIETYTDGRAALARVLEEPPDLLLLDLMMPDLDGFALLERVDQAELTVPIIIVTAHTTMANAIEAMKRGAMDYLSKPFTPEEHGYMDGYAMNGNGKEDFELEYLQHDNYALVWCVKE